MCHVVGDEPLEAVGLRNQTAELFLIRRCRFRLDRGGLAETIPVAGGERILNAGEQLGDSFESDDYSPVSAAMCAQASRRSVRLLATNGSEVASLFRLASVSRSRQKL